MALWTFTQLRRLIAQAGGGRYVQTVGAAIAKGVESNGTPTVLAGGVGPASGLWQFEPTTWAQYAPPGAPRTAGQATPLEQAQAFVAAVRANGGFAPWAPDLGGSWGENPTVPGAASPVSRYLSQLGVALPKRPATLAGAVTSSAGHKLNTQGASSGAGLGSIVSEASSMLTKTSTLTHDAAVVLDRAFGMFQPGQGTRIGVAAGTVAAGAAGIRSWRQATSEQGGGSFPLAVGLLGLAVLGAFIALRPWPMVSGKPIKPGAYAAAVLEGHPPKATKATQAGAVTAIQAGLDSILLLWAIGKVARAFSAVSGAIRGLVGAPPGKGGSGEATGGTGTATGGGETLPTGQPPLVNPTPTGGIDVGGATGLGGGGDLGIEGG